MKIPKIFAAAAMTVCLTATSTVFAAGTPNAGSAVYTGSHKAETRHHDSLKAKGAWYGKGCYGESGDPVEMLKARKEKIRKLLEEGTITKEKADFINGKIDAAMKEIQDFNALPLDQKKEKLLTRLKESMGQKVKNGKLTQDKADEMINGFSKEIEQWDGKGYPTFFKKALRQHSKNGH